jgi:hypothetical protein
MVANTFSEEYIFFSNFLKPLVFSKGQFRKSPGLIRPMPAVIGLRGTLL